MFTEHIMMCYVVMPLYRVVWPFECIATAELFFFIEAIPLCDNISILYIPILHNNLH